MSPPALNWDMGTAYDMFVSLTVLHDPARFGVRPAWAAGVRARLPAAERQTLEEYLAAGQQLIPVPFQWIYRLPKPKDGAAVLQTLQKVPAADRLECIAVVPDWPGDKFVDTLRGVAARGDWEGKDLEAVAASYRRLGRKRPPPPERLTAMLDVWARPEEFGERYLAALRAYYDVFFREEELRIGPALQAALSRAQALAQQLSQADLLEELSKGLRFEEHPGDSAVVLVPSYWCTPLMFFGMVAKDREIRLFGARPPNASLDPGEVVPDKLLRALKALSDPTRLRILRYLSEEPLSPAQLSRRLRLRAPTVTHHLKALRLAELVQLTLGEGQESKGYATRAGAVAAAFSLLQDFLENDKDHLSITK
jgi:DNA-binding transcriptional ArsR family regulator